MSRHHYPIGTLSSDYLRVALGLALTLGPLLALELAAPIAWLLAGLAILFLWFGLRTGLRQLSAVELSPQGIAIRGPFGRELAWDELAHMKLAYYAPRGWGGPRRRERQHERGERDEGRRGWLQLTLQGARGRADPGRIRRWRASIRCCAAPWPWPPASSSSWIRPPRQTLARSASIAASRPMRRSGRLHPIAALLQVRAPGALFEPRQQLLGSHRLAEVEALHLIAAERAQRRRTRPRSRPPRRPRSGRGSWRA